MFYLLLREKADLKIKKKYEEKIKIIEKLIL
jgi:hypothetical protein